jgi:hypothetical protein
MREGTIGGVAFDLEKNKSPTAVTRGAFS